MFWNVESCVKVCCGEVKKDVVPSLRCEDYGNSTNEATEPSIAPLVRMLSDHNQLRLDMGPDYEIKNTYNNKKGNYEHFHPSMLDTVENATSGRRGIMNTLGWSNPGADYTNYMCHILLTTWRRAKNDMIDYYKIRDLYSSTLDYEIGYLTHVIIAKYMDTLEVIDMVRYRFYGGGVTANYAPSQWVWYMYTNVLDNTKHIIHLCNMLNEVKKKYAQSYGDTPWDQVMAPAKPGPGGKGGPGGGGGVGGKGNEEGQQAAMTHKEFLEKQERARRKKAKEALKRHQAMMKFAVTLSQTTMTKRPRQFWIHRPGKLDYGWSIEQWWT